MNRIEGIIITREMAVAGALSYLNKSGYWS